MPRGPGATAGLSSNVLARVFALHCRTSRQWHPCSTGCQRVRQRSFRAFGHLATLYMEALVSNRRSSSEPGLDAFADCDDSAACDPAADGANSGPWREGQNDIDGLKKGSKLKSASDEAYTDIATSLGQGCKLRRPGELSTTPEETTSGYRCGFGGSVAKCRAIPPISPSVNSPRAPWLCAPTSRSVCRFGYYECAQLKRTGDENHLLNQ